MSRLKRFAQLSWGERLLLLRLVFLFPIVRISLHWFGFKRVHGAMARIMRHSETPASAEALSEARAVGRLVRLAANWTGATCLPRSMTLWWLLNRRGIDSELRIGVRMEDTRLLAHAWIEVHGKVINDHPKVRFVYTPFAGDVTKLAVL